MSMHEFRLKLTLAAPCLSQAAGAMALGVDAAMQRYDGKPAFNGSQIRGNLRHLLAYFVDELGGYGGLTHKDIKHWFGPEEGTEAETQRAALTFDWAWTQDEVRDASGNSAQDMRYRITLDDDGSVKPGHLQVIEAPYPVGAQVSFCGSILARIDPDAPRDAHNNRDAITHLRHWLTKAAQALPAIGAFKGAGFGRVLAAELTGGEALTASAHPAKGKPNKKWAKERIGIVLRPDRPFHLAVDVPHQPQNNRRLYPAQIPGAAIKALMARAWNDNPSTDADLNERFAFNQLVVTNALAAASGRVGRHPTLPLSLALVDQDPPGTKARLVDLALCRTPCLIRGGNDWKAPRFLPDWKERELSDVEQQAHGNKLAPEVSAILSVRTAINRDSKVSDEGRLFALEVTEHKDHRWCADIDLALVEEGRREDVVRNLKELLSKPLYGLGKTAATLHVELQIKGPCTIPNEPAVRDPLILSLRSPARMLPDELDLSAINDDQTLHALYDAYFRQCSDDMLRLSHCFAQQEMVGGEFYRVHHLHARDYRPVWLSRAGSVFVLSIDADADLTSLKALLREWTRAGLPPHGNPSAWDWKENPFLRQNGFGEILLNDPLHAKLAPKADELLDLANDHATDYDTNHGTDPASGSAAKEASA